MGTWTKLGICGSLGWKKEEKEGILSENPAEKKEKNEEGEGKWRKAKGMEMAPATAEVA
ncbi:hypothetical protein Csa_009360 [Cucumis sativus]|uniref:Uncharacterized protein n=1 Tax=Cucumis sativus TaxID=3659 RepID=A0A0A0KTL5_CUCSA|nr:hypothetical protein Csa_009360 [Cucumis sativus]